jgi:hypothetical protein
MQFFSPLILTVSHPSSIVFHKLQDFFQPDEGRVFCICTALGDVLYLVCKFADIYGFVLCSRGYLLLRNKPIKAAPKPPSMVGAL